jgi:hypothetical protein
VRENGSGVIGAAYVLFSSRHLHLMRIKQRPKPQQRNGPFEYHYQQRLIYTTHTDHRQGDNVEREPKPSACQSFYGNPFLNSDIFISRTCRIAFRVPRCS